MSSIQYSLIGNQDVFLSRSLEQPNDGDGFEVELCKLGLEEMSNPVDLNNLKVESTEDVPVLSSDIALCQKILANISMGEDAQLGQIQLTSVNLTRDQAPQEESVGMPALKECAPKELETDETDVDPSMMIPLVPMDIRFNSVVLKSSELKIEPEFKQANANANANAKADDLLSKNPTHDAKKLDIRDDANDKATLHLTDKAIVNPDVTQEILPSVSVNKENVSQDRQKILMPTAESISQRMDNSMVMVSSASAKTTRDIQPTDDDRMMDEVPIVSIALKRDPVTHGISIKTLASDLNSQNESLTQDQMVVLKTKISEAKISDDGVVQETQETETGSSENEFEKVESSVDSAAKESTLKPASISTHTELSEFTPEVNISKSAPTHQILQAVLDAKEGVVPKESKTLTVVLNPEELGVVNVELTADETGKLSAVLSVEKRETLDALQQDLHQLKTVLKEIGIDESSVSLQLSSNNEHGQQKQSEYVAWEEREQMLMRSHQKPINTVTEKATYPERQSLRRLDIKA